MVITANVQEMVFWRDVGLSGRFSYVDSRCGSHATIRLIRGAEPPGVVPCLARLRMLKRLPSNWALPL
eukprot:4597924-Pyramimonas_sp.AAC.1